MRTVLDAQLKFYKIENSHFQIGRYFHSDTFYLLKQFYENTNNSILIGNEISKIVANFNVPKHKKILFVGYRNFLTLTLQTLCAKMDKEYAFNTIELNEGSFQWSMNNDNFTEDFIIVIVLPISSSQDTYLRLYNFLVKQFGSKFVSKEFISIIQIIDGSALDLKNNDNRVAKVRELYDSFNWKIDSSSNVINFLVKSGKTESIHSAYSLIKKDRQLYPRESCELCFKKYKALVKTDARNEALHVLFEVGNYFKRSSNLNLKNYIDLFGNNHMQSLLYNTVNISNVYFTNFINSKNFYFNNKDKILRYFNEVFKNLNCKENVFIITSDFLYGSNFIGDFVLNSEELKGKRVNVLRVTLSEDYLDYFLSSVTRVSELKNSTIIYFEDVLSSAKNLKKVSEYLKVISSKENNGKRKGIDFIFSLIDRTNFYTHEDIKKRTNIKEQLFAFININTPITSPFHLDTNNHDKKQDSLKVLRPELSLDILQSRIKKIIKENSPKTLYSVNNGHFENQKVDYNIFEHVKNLPKENINLSLYRHDLLRFYLLHLLNNFISENTQKDLEMFISRFFHKLELIKKELLQIFTEVVNEDAANVVLEFSKEQTIKHLTGHPYVVFNNLKQIASNFVVQELKNNDIRIKNNGGIKSFREFRKYKFYISRSVNLGIDYIISKEFLLSLKLQYDKKRIEELYVIYGKEKDGALYKLNQITGYFSFLLYNYKLLLRQDHYKSLRLERILNSKEFETTENDIYNYITEPFNNFKGMLICENNSLIHALVNENIIKTIGDSSNIKYHFFRKNSSKKDPIIIMNKKLVYLNDYELLGPATAKYIKLYRDLKKKNYDKYIGENINFIEKIRNVVDKYASIINLDKLESDYLFVYRSKFNYKNQDFCLLNSDNSGNYKHLKIDENGFINSYFDGVSEFKKESLFSAQSLVTFVKKDGHFVTYKQNLYRKNNTEINLSDALQIDTQNIQELSKAEMLVAIRITDADNPNYSAIMIFFSNFEPGLDIFNEMFNDAKLRLILALKKPFLQYLFRQFEHGGYNEFITSQNDIMKTRKLEHNLSGSLTNLEWCFSQVVKNRHNNRLNSLEFDLNLRSIRSQLEKPNVKDYQDVVRTSIEIKEYVLNLFQLRSIGKYSAREFQPIIIEKSERFNINDALFFIVLPEIVSNMKKHAPRENPEWKVHISKNQINFSNKILRDTTSTGKGVEICKYILKELGLPRLEKKEDKEMYYLTLKLK